ncbi:MAG: hypothetical protein J7639_31645 [Paenibacillaceae bacterium]|nr:hypothetical protein [Paenibacillaceae bacterium]
MFSLAIFYAGVEIGQISQFLLAILDALRVRIVSATEAMRNSSVLVGVASVALVLQNDK